MPSVSTTRTRCTGGAVPLAVEPTRMPLIGEFVTMLPVTSTFDRLARIYGLGCSETLQFLSKLSVAEAVDKVLSGEDSAEDIFIGASEWVEGADGTKRARYLSTALPMRLHVAAWVKS